MENPNKEQKILPALDFLASTVDNYEAFGDLVKAFSRAADALCASSYIGQSYSEYMAALEKHAHELRSALSQKLEA